MWFSVSVAGVRESTRNAVILDLVDVSCCVRMSVRVCANEVGMHAQRDDIIIMIGSRESSDKTNHRRKMAPSKIGLAPPSTHKPSCWEKTDRLIDLLFPSPRPRKFRN